MAAYAITIFLGAFLLFQVQPLIGKFILPWFGGGSSVWTTCMLFFQWLLLGGYLYTHWTSVKPSPRAQATIHLFVLGLSALFLPIIPDIDWKPTPDHQPTLRILLLLAATVGAPYFVLATTGPLIQRWFNLSQPEGNPYRLYALSNIGSLLALVSYPFAFEPWLGRVHQAHAWSAGMVLFIFCCGWCAWKIRQADPGAEPPPQPQGHSRSAAHPAPITPLQRSLWITLPAAASLLLLASTNKICLDVASFPFLWILPLSLYLLSFIICFDRPNWYFRPVWISLLVLSFCAVILVMEEKLGDTIVQQLTVYSVVLFVGCMVCHGELFRLKPPPASLTGYYLMISVGGALGGLLAAVAAPLLLDGYYEFHVSLILVALLLLAVFFVDPNSPFHRGRPRVAWTVLLTMPALLAWGLSRDIGNSRANAIDLSRNFYGALTVIEYDRDLENGHHFLLRHGGITHGLQVVDSWASTEPTTYYTHDSGIGLAMRALPKESMRRIGVVGLGTGTMAAHGKAGDIMRIYEIDPAVVELARRRFTYLNDSEAELEIILGDARLSMEREPPQEYDILVVDAFSSDAIPVHLITREAFEIYWRHLKPDGVLAMHISNLHLKLEPVVSALAREFDYEAWQIANLTDDEDWWAYYSDWALITRNKAFLNHEAVWDNAYLIDPPPAGFRLWTDDYSSIFAVMDWTVFEDEGDDEDEIDSEHPEEN